MAEEEEETELETIHIHRHKIEASDDGRFQIIRDTKSGKVVKLVEKASGEVFTVGDDENGYSVHVDANGNEVLKDPSGRILRIIVVDEDGNGCRELFYITKAI